MITTSLTGLSLVNNIFYFSPTGSNRVFEISHLKIFKKIVIIEENEFDIRRSDVSSCFMEKFKPDIFT